MPRDDFWLRIGVACGLLVFLTLYFMWSETQELLADVSRNLFDYKRMTAAAAVRDGATKENHTDA